MTELRSNEVSSFAIKMSGTWSTIYEADTLVQNINNFYILNIEKFREREKEIKKFLSVILCEMERNSRLSMLMHKFVNS